MAPQDIRHKSEKETAFLEKLSRDFCDPRAMTHDGKVQKGDFVWMREGFGWIFFLKPKNPRKKPRILYDGEPKFVKLSSTLKSFGERTITVSLSIFAQRFGLSFKKLKTRSKKEEMWQFC